MTERSKTCGERRSNNGVSKMTMTIAMPKVSDFHNAQSNDGQKASQPTAVFQILADDELVEASIRQRVRKIESHLFDEYWAELLAEKIKLAQ